LDPEYDPEACFKHVLKKHEGDENGKKWVRMWYRTKYGMCDIEDKLWTKIVEVEA
jgi:hypothetical protein